MSNNMSTSFSITTEQEFVTVNGGMSAEIVFGKYVAAARYNVYKNWNNQIVNVDSNPNIIADTLQMIANIITSIETSRETPSQGMLISPGFLSAPYMVELMDLIYLPSHILVGVNSIAPLERALDRAQAAGIDCYAVLGYDTVVPTCLVAWIKFRSIPPVFQQLIRDLHIRNVIAMGVWDANGVTSGESINRAYGRNKNVFFTYVNEAYGRLEEDEQIFKYFLGEDAVSSILKPRLFNLGDWESSIDYLTQFLLPIEGMIITQAETPAPHHPIFNTRSGCKKINTVKCYCFFVDNTVNLYHLATELAGLFMKRNNVSQKGVVLNPYIISNPLYEVMYGYLPIVYWQFNEQNPEIYKKYLKTGEGGELWVNLVLEDSTCNLVPSSVTPTVQLTEYQLGSWISQYRPVSKPRVQYLNIVDLKIMANGVNIKNESF
jgi:hypothetical protein